MAFFPASSEFTEGHELPGKWKVAKEMVGGRLWGIVLEFAALFHYSRGLKAIAISQLLGPPRTSPQ
jgi:hypothetical protein